MRRAGERGSVRSMSCTIVKRDGERLAPVLARHGDRRLARDRRDEALELEPQRLAFRRLERDALDERLDARARALATSAARSTSLRSR